MNRVDHIDFSLPGGMIYVSGLSKQGKTYWVVNGLVPELLKQGCEIHYVVNRKFDIERPLAEQALKHKKIFIHRAEDLSQKTLDKMMEIVRANDKKKAVIVDNFTFDLSLAFLNYTTFARKFNSSSVFLGHTLYASKTISPRLREMVAYFVLFYAPVNKSYKQLLGTDLYEAYKENIHAYSYEFMIIDQGSEQWTIGKLPQYKIMVSVEDQDQGGGKLGEALKQINKPKEEQKEKEMETQTRLKSEPNTKGAKIVGGKLRIPAHIKSRFHTPQIIS